MLTWIGSLMLSHLQTFEDLADRTKVIFNVLMNNHLQWSDDLPK